MTGELNMSQATKNKIFRAITYLLVLGTVLSATVFFYIFVSTTELATLNYILLALPFFFLILLQFGNVVTHMDEIEKKGFGYPILLLVYMILGIGLYIYLMNLFWR
ncbi:hypothetical protein ACU6T0_05615 [Avibacterium paragallinarum]